MPIMIADLFQYGFIVRGLEAGIIVALIAPIIGIFLVLRRYSLIADTLAHVSFAGIALGALVGINPLFAALGATLVSALGIERLRATKRIYGESALALFLSGSLALAVVLLSIGHGFTAGLFGYLFGSILTVTQSDVYIVAALGLVTAIALLAFFKELVYVTFDEEAARVSGIPVRFINTILIFLAALTVSFSIPIVGVLLIGALAVIPAITALQLRANLGNTIFWAEAISLFSVVAGILLSFYLNIATGGTIVLLMLMIFIAVLAAKKS